jgi:osmotically inducible lipoprotein OsmB
MNTTRPVVRTLRRSVLLAALAGLALAGGGCSNAGTGALSGAGIGAGAGAIIGSITGSAGKGAVIGTIVGGVAGGVVGDQNERRERDRRGY